VRARSIAALVLAAAAACSGTPEPSIVPLPSADAKPAWIAAQDPPEAIASYRIEARLDLAKRRIRGSQTLTWVNTGGTAVTELPFHLYMNAFKNEDSVFMRESGGRHRRAEADRGAWGWIEVQSISVGVGANERERARFPGPDETVLELPLARPIEAGERVEVGIEFEVQLPRVFARTGYAGPFFLVGQWFPKIGVRVGPRGQESWHAEPMHLTSEFFADFGDYEVSLTVPDTHVVAATGVLAEARDNPDATRTLVYRARGVHDFAWMADPFMRSISATAATENGPVEVAVYFQEPDRAMARRHLEVGVAAIEAFSRTLVPYPWPRLTIVVPPPDAAAGAGGMEYPTFVTTVGASAFIPETIRQPEFVTVHEVAHNWFQGILASNEVDDAWLDEGLTEYATATLLDQLYGRETAAADWGPLYAGFHQLLSAKAAPFAGNPDPIARRSHEFADFASYARTTYGKTMAMLYTLEHAVGIDRFRAALTAYARAMAFQHPTGGDFRRIFERELGEDLAWFLDPALGELGAADLRVRSILCRPGGRPRGIIGHGAERREQSGAPADGAPQRCRVTVENLGRVPVPVDIELRLSDGKRIRRRWDDRGDHPRWHLIEVEDKHPVVEVMIDPDRRVLLDDGGLYRSLRVTPRADASRRAAARGQFWTQSAMQVLGL
jgi:hypothetical protein